jgi:hypothetical protein
MLVMVEKEMMVAGLVCADAQILTIEILRKRERKEAVALGTGICFSEELSMMQER